MCVADFVLERFPNCSQSQFSAAVNSCTGHKALNKPAVEVLSCSEWFVKYFDCFGFNKSLHCCSTLWKVKRVMRMKFEWGAGR